jgi:hypothetical protein
MRGAGGALRMEEGLGLGCGVGDGGFVCGCVSV